MVSRRLVYAGHQGKEGQRRTYDAVIPDLTFTRHGWSRYFARMARKGQRAGIDPDCARCAKERVEGLRLGVDDYLVNLCVKVARLTRCAEQRPGQTSCATNALDASAAGGEPLNAETKEFALLELPMQRWSGTTAN